MDIAKKAKVVRINAQIDDYCMIPGLGINCDFLPLFHRAVTELSPPLVAFPTFPSKLFLVTHPVGGNIHDSYAAVSAENYHCCAAQRAPPPPPPPSPRFVVVFAVCRVLLLLLL